MTAAQIRQQFLHFFQQKGHIVVPSAPIVIKNDPTLLFTNAGMNQFKDIFLGNRPAENPRVADTQKCLRVSGKHNDLEEVGVDTYHHTMFEMLGNWSFGDYFKKEAIEWSWELLTDVFGIAKEQLYVSVFGGDAGEGMARDEEALAFWKELVPEERIIFGSKKDNFWEMGDTGPCGPCSEIHVDCRSTAERADGNGANLVNADHPQVIEIWNNVFMQYNRLKDGSLQPLPARHVDTGMGFERLVRVLQGKQSNYDTDVFSGTIAEVETLTGHRYTATDSKADVAFRVLADHIRAISFTIADGQLPGSTGAGYVIRRILRRAVRYAYSYLDARQPLLHQLVAGLATQFADVFPNLKAQESFVQKVIKEEEDAFLRTLEKGLKRLDTAIEKASGAVINGEEAFKMYDTYGFPIDLTRLIAGEHGLTVDEAGFEQQMAIQKNTARAATQIDAGDWTVLHEGRSTFIGYEEMSTKTRVLRYRKVKAKGKESYQIVLERTPFYAESGGQVGDSGWLEIAGGKFKIFDTKKENELTIHFSEGIAVDMSGEVVATVDAEKRHPAEAHHSATHLLHAALRRVLGGHVAQKGSLVSADYLRFDFSHFSKMTEVELMQVQAIVNEKIRENIPVEIVEMTKDEALEQGAMALFGEKYGDTVRVVTMGKDYSIELCGGTHTQRTGNLGFFVITSESAVAAGVRRVEALSGAAAAAYLENEQMQLRAARELLKNPKDLAAAIENMQQETSNLRKAAEAAEAKQLARLAKELAADAEVVSAFQFVGSKEEVSSMEALRKLAGEVLAHLEAGVAVLTAEVSGKANVAIALSPEAQAAGLDAGQLIKTIVAPIVKGGGGGSKGLATAGGGAVGALPEAIAGVKAEVGKLG